MICKRRLAESRMVRLHDLFANIQRSGRAEKVHRQDLQVFMFMSLCRPCKALNIDTAESQFFTINDFTFYLNFE